MTLTITIMTLTAIHISCHLIIIAFDDIIIAFVHCRNKYLIDVKVQSFCYLHNVKELQRVPWIGLLDDAYIWPKGY